MVKGLSVNSLAGFGTLEQLAAGASNHGRAISIPTLVSTLSNMAGICAGGVLDRSM